MLLKQSRMLRRRAKQNSACSFSASLRLAAVAAAAPSHSSVAWRGPCGSASRQKRILHYAHRGWKLWQRWAWDKSARLCYDALKAADCGIRH
jgi:hypothetical protein